MALLLLPYIFLLCVLCRYGLKLENPKEFYHEVHRPGHFLKFESLEGNSVGEGADREDHFD